MNSLDLYDQKYPEIVSNLFKAYKLIEEREFATYIMITRHGYNANPMAYQPRILMEGVENHYKLALEACTWDPNMVKKELSEITALKLEIEALRVETHKNKEKRARQAVVLTNQSMNGRKFLLQKERQNPKNLRIECIIGVQHTIIGQCIRQKNARV
jgi:hypothetical protein